MNTKIHRLNSQDSVRELVHAYWNEVRAAPQEGRPVAWSTMHTPSELLNTLGFRVVYPENYAATCGAWKAASKFCQIAEDAFYSPDTCVYARNSLGSVLTDNKDICPVGGLPKPDVLICFNYCSAVLKWYQELSRIYNVPIVAIEYPFLHDHLDQEQIARVGKYASDQMRDAVPLLEKVARRSLDVELWKHSLTITAEMVEVWKRVLALAQHVPSPVSCFDLFFNVFPMACLRGNPSGLEVLNGLEAELRDRIANGVWAMPEEKHRLYWGGIPIWYRIGDLRRRFAEEGVNIVASSYLYAWRYIGMDASKPFECTLPPQMFTPINIGLTGQRDFIASLVRDYAIDGMVWQLDRSCKYVGIGSYDWIESMKKEFGIPVMTIEADMCDDRTYRQDHVESDIAAFLEILSGTR